MRVSLLLWCVLVCVTEAKFNYKKFNKLFDSSEEEFHGSGETIRREEVRASKPNDGYRVKSACYKQDKNKIVLVDGTTCDKDTVLAATGKYVNKVNQTGWGILEIETFANTGITEAIQAYAAGVLEGYLTKLQIYYNFRNTVEGMCNPDPGIKAYCKRLYKFLKRNMEWISSQVLKNKDDRYWQMINLTYTQITGINDGYADNSTLTPSVAFELTPIFMLHMAGELIDLSKVLKKPTTVEDDPEPGKCSGFLKVAAGNKDLFFSHVAMSGYNTMNRVLKLYKFAYNRDKVPGHTYSFSSYAGVIVSADDYTLVSSGLASIETTFAIFNETLYSDKYVKPEGQLMCFVRSTVANQMAKTAKEWTDIFALHNSGTYNNQWTVVDYKMFTPGKELPNNNVVWILEQISKLSGFDAKGEISNWWKWGYSPRAKIFQRDHQKVTDIESLRKLMRYNDYTHDEFSRCKCSPPYTAEAGVSARGDLNPANGTYEVPGMGHRNHGSLDYKGTNYTLFQKLRMDVIGGPAFDPLPPFSWDTTDIVTPHYGQPVLWKFDPFIVEWENKVEVNMTPVINEEEEEEFWWNKDDKTEEESSSERLQF